MFKAIICISLLFWISITISDAQSPRTCELAQSVCELDTIFLSSHTTSHDMKNTVSQLCGVDVESTTHYTGANWLRYEFATSGDFLFTIYPSSMVIDIDFQVFTSEGDCSNLTSVRCMFSGSYNYHRCMGTTGLSRQSYDVFERAGCDYSDDNYLAAIDVNQGDVLYVAIYNSDKDKTNYQIVHGGTARLICQETLHTTQQNNVNISNTNVADKNEDNKIDTVDIKTSNDDNKNYTQPLNVDSIQIAALPQKIYTQVYPNPTAGILKIISNLSITEKIGLEIYDKNGKNHMRQSVSLNAIIDISHLASGVYFIKLHDDGKLIYTQQIINIK